MIRTHLNAEMLVVVGPMARDVAAFTNPLDALEFLEVLKPRIRKEMYYRRPDGASTAVALDAVVVTLTAPQEA